MDRGTIIEVETDKGKLRLPLIEYLGYVQSRETWLAMASYKNRPLLVLKRGSNSPWHFWSHEGVTYARTRGQPLVGQPSRRQRGRSV